MNVRGLEIADTVNNLAPHMGIESFMDSDVVVVSSSHQSSR